MKKRKNKKRKPAMPPLSLLDRTLYTLGYLSSILLGFGLLVLFFYLRRRIAFSAADTLAAEETASLLFGLPAILYLSVSLIGVISAQNLKRRPLFGKKGVRYGAPRWAEIYPLFSKDFRKRPPEEMRPSNVKARKAGRLTWLILLCLLLCLVPFGLFGRKTADNSGHFYLYNAVGAQTAAYEAADIAAVNVKCRRDYRSNTVVRRSVFTSVLRRIFFSDNVTFSITLTMNDGETCSFSVGDFSKTFRGSDAPALSGMLYLKSLVPEEKVEYTGREYADVLIDQYDLDADETALLYELFDIEQ